jgi:hypothetical protein
MRYLLIALLLSGCSTVVPVTAKFPEAPKLGLVTCPNLDIVPEGVKLSELTNTVTKNYNTYYECAVRVETWQQWYEIQKRIFEGVVK